MNLAKLAVVVGASTKGFQRGLYAAERRVDALERHIGRMRGGLTQAGGGLASFAKKAAFVGAVTLVALTAALGGVVNASIEYEDAFAGVRKTVSATEPELVQLSRDIRQMATEIPIAATELAHLGETAGALGVPTKNIKEFIRVTALLGVTTDLSAQEAADSLGVLGNVLKLRADDYSRFGSALVALGNAGASTESQIIGIAQRMGAAGKLAGLSTPQLLGFASAVASLGIEPEAAGTAMQTFFISTLKFASAGGKHLNVLAKTAGLTGRQFKTAFDKDAGGALLTFFRGMNKLGKAERLAVLDALGFKDARISRTLLGLADNSQMLAEQLGLSASAWRDNTAMATEAEKRFATTKSQLGLLKNNLLEIAMTLGDAILPALTPLIVGLNSWITANHDLIAQLAGQLATGISTIVGGIGSWIGANRPLIVQVGTTLFNAGVSVADFISTTLIPALLAIGAFIGTSVIPKVQAFIDTLTKPGGVADSITKVVGPILNSLIPAFGSILTALFGGTTGGGGRNGRVGAATSKGLVPAIGDLIGVLWGNGDGALAGVLKGVSTIFTGVVAPAISGIIGVIETLVGWVTKGIDALSKLQKKAGEIGIHGNLSVPLFVPGLGGLGLAGGGVFSPNVPTFVGENGPELVVPRHRDTVVPNDQLQAGRSGGGDVNVYVQGLLRAETPEDVGRTLRRYAGLGLLGAPRTAGAGA